MTNLSVTTTLKRSPFRSAKDKALLSEIKDRVLGKSFNIGLVFIGEARAKRLNEDYRKKNYSPNVLTFPLSKTEGEIFINVPVAKKEAREMEISERKRVAHLFIHGLLHLKGLPHGSRMDSEEERLLEKYGF